MTTREAVTYAVIAAIVGAVILGIVAAVYFGVQHSTQVHERIVTACLSGGGSWIEYDNLCIR